MLFCKYKFCSKYLEDDHSCYAVFIVLNEQSEITLQLKQQKLIHP
jgi:hypothetical protein